MTTRGMGKLVGAKELGYSMSPSHLRMLNWQPKLKQTLLSVQAAADIPSHKGAVILRLKAVGLRSRRAVVKSVSPVNTTPSSIC